MLESRSLFDAGSAMLRLPHRWLVQSVLRRESSELASGSSGRAIGGRSKKQEQEESVLHTGALFLNSQIWPCP